MYDYRHNLPAQRPQTLYTIERLNTMVYKNDSDDDEFLSNVNCNYIEPFQLKDKITSKDLTIMSFNVRSMFQNFNNFKTEILQSGAKLDIFGLCESHLTSTNQKLYMVDHYNFYSTNIASNKGGVCLYVRNDLKCKVRQDLSMRKG